MNIVVWLQRWGIKVGKDDRWWMTDDRIWFGLCFLRLLSVIRHLPTVNLRENLQNPIFNWLGMRVVAYDD